MKIRNFAHKGLKQLYVEANARGVPPDYADKLRKMFAYLDNMGDPAELGCSRCLQAAYAYR